MYLFKDGLIRLCTEDYTTPTKDNINDSAMHLTNYSLQKDKPNFKVSENVDEGTKRALSSFLKEMVSTEAKTKHQSNNNMKMSHDNTKKYKTSKNNNNNNNRRKKRNNNNNNNREKIDNDFTTETPTFNEKQFWKDCSDIISTTLFALKPQLSYAYQTSLQLKKTKKTFQDINFRCFQILGFDIMMDEQFKLHLIEGNCAPSLNIYTKDNSDQPEGKFF